MIPCIVDLSLFTIRDISDKLLHWLYKLIIIFRSSTVVSLFFRFLTHVVTVMIKTALYVIATIPDNVLKSSTTSERSLKLITLCLHNKILIIDLINYNCTNTYYAFISVDIYINNMNIFFVYLILLFYRL